MKKLMTMAELAKLAGVAESTVSRALAGSPRISEKTRTHIRQLMEANGYQINARARALRTQKTHTIAVVITISENNKQHFSDPFFSQLIASIADALSARNYDLLLSRTPPWEQGADAVLSGRADGLIFIGQGDYPEQLENCAANNYPMVVWGAQLPNQSYCSIGTDNRLGGELVGQHLAKLGRKRVAFLGDINQVEIGLRYEGCLAGFNASQDGQVVSLATTFDVRSAYAATCGLIEKGGWHDAIFSANDVIAVSAIQALHDHGLRVPEDIAVIGYDDVAMASFSSPALTTVKQSTQLGGQLLVQKLFEILNGTQPDSEQLETELVIRKSCGAVKRNTP